MIMKGKSMDIQGVSKLVVQTLRIDRLYGTK